MLKDHYRVLGLPPSATPGEIKKAYRRLAHEYHPDKSHGDPYAKEKFEAIKEAYEVLTNPVKKEHYLQQRWYQQSTGSRSTAEIITPENILKRALELSRHVRTLDAYRMDRNGLFGYIDELLSNETVEKLNVFGETDINNEIATALLSALALLHEQQMQTVVQRLLNLKLSTEMGSKISAFEYQDKKRRRWERLKPWLVVTVVILLCILIVLVSR